MIEKPGRHHLNQVMKVNIAGTMVCMRSVPQAFMCWKLGPYHGDVESEYGCLRGGFYWEVVRSLRVLISEMINPLCPGIPYNGLR